MFRPSFLITHVPDWRQQCLWTKVLFVYLTGSGAHRFSVEGSDVTLIVVFMLWRLKCVTQVSLDVTLWFCQHHNWAIFSPLGFHVDKVECRLCIFDLPAQYYTTKTLAYIHASKSVKGFLFFFCIFVCKQQLEHPTSVTKEHAGYWHHSICELTFFYVI